MLIFVGAVFDGSAMVSVFGYINLCEYNMWRCNIKKRRRKADTKDGSSKRSGLGASNVTVVCFRAEDVLAISKSLYNE